MRRLRELVRSDDGAVAVLYSIVFVLVLLPLLAISTTTLVRGATTSELQRAADAGALAGAAAIPFGDVNFARNFIDQTAGGKHTDARLRQLGLDYPGQEPTDIACDGVAKPNANDPSEVGSTYAVAGTLDCKAEYLSDPDTLAALQACAAGLAAQSPGSGDVSGVTSSLPTVPDLSPLLPVLLRPGVQVKMTWDVKSPTGTILGGHTSTETVTSVAHRRFKNMVVVPDIDYSRQFKLWMLSGGVNASVNLNPFAGDVRTLLLDAIDGTEQLLNATPQTAVCSGVLDGAHDDIVDAISPPANGPDFRTIVDDAWHTHSPVIVAGVVTGLSVPFLDFFPVCVDYVDGHYVGHLTDFGSCSVMAPGAFRASLRK